MHPLGCGFGNTCGKVRDFKEFLTGNRNALRSLAELEMLYYGGQPFTAADVAFLYEQLFGQVRALVNVLNNLSEQRYTALNERANAINAQVRRVLRQAVVRQNLPPVIALADLPVTAIDDAGGKSANLARIARKTGLAVSPGFVVTASGYDRFLKANRLEQFVIDELAGLSPEDPRLTEISDRLGKLILEAHVPEDLVESLRGHYAAIERALHPGVRMAMRSSAVGEDSEASFAGQYHSVLNVDGEGLALAYKQVVASSFSPRTISYRRMNGIDLTETPMCVLGLAMVDAAASGVLYTADPTGAMDNSVREMFSLSSEAENVAATVRLTTYIPLVLHLIDLGGGLTSGLSTCDTVTAAHFTSAPLQALWRGFTHPGISWSGTVQFAGNRFLARLATAATSEFGPEPGGDSYALIGDDYLNLSAKFNYHFATLDTFCGDEPDHNYLSLQFSGGAGSYFGKTLRLQFLAEVLRQLGCTVSMQGDMLEASCNRHGRAEMLLLLDQIGRLLVSSRLLDLAITDQKDAEILAGDFLGGNYDLLRRKEQSLIQGFYTYLGHWREIDEDGARC